MMRHLFHCFPLSVLKFENHLDCFINVFLYKALIMLSITLKNLYTLEILLVRTFLHKTTGFFYKVKLKAKKIYQQCLFIIQDYYSTKNT